MQTSERPCHVTWHTTPPSPAQLAAWRWLWARLLGYCGPETPQPQGSGESGAAPSTAAVSGGRHTKSGDYDESTTHSPTSR